MKSELLRLNDANRRDFMLRTAKSVLGVSLLPGISAKMAAAEAVSKSGPGTAGFGKAKHVIYLWMGGGMTHIDTFDPKEVAIPNGIGHRSASTIEAQELETNDSNSSGVAAIVSIPVAQTRHRATPAEKPGR